MIVGLRMIAIFGRNGINRQLVEMNPWGTEMKKMMAEMIVAAVVGFVKKVEARWQRKIREEPYAVRSSQMTENDVWGKIAPLVEIFAVSAYERTAEAID